MGTISSSYLQSVVSATLQNAGWINNTNSGSTTLTGSFGLRSDTRQLSPFAQMMSTLRQLQQSDPAKYKQVTQQISANLQTAAQTARQSGNSTAATQLNRLASDFNAASQSGQLPNIPGLASAVNGHHGHHHGHAHRANGQNDQSLNQILSAFQTGTAPNAATDPLAIIQSTLASANLTTSA